MRINRVLVAGGLVVIGALVAGLVAAGSSAQAIRALDFNGRANFQCARGRFGVTGAAQCRRLGRAGTMFALTSGFQPDPWPFAITAGGGRSPVDVSTLGLTDASTGQPCGRSYVTRRPDFHFWFNAGSFPLVRFYYVAQADATLLINQPDTRWRCNDDHHHPGWGNSLMPALDFANPASGRYDIWVGTYNATAGNPGTLFVTELDANHP